MKSVDRTGLYIMVFITMLSTCSNEDRLARLEKELLKSPAHEVAPEQIKDGTAH